MKKVLLSFFSLSVLVLGLSLNSCKNGGGDSSTTADSTQTNAETPATPSINGKWAVADIQFLKEVPAENQPMIEQMKEMMKKTTITFNENGTVVSEGVDPMDPTKTKMDTSSWKSNNGSYVIVEKDQSETPLEVTNDNITINIKNEVKLVLKKA